MTGDVTRRALLCSLDPMLERPELRQFMGNPVATVLQDRAKYIAAALTIVRAYFLEGQPNQAPRLASFEGWSDTVRSALIWLGCEDPVTTMERAREEDPQLILLRQMLSGWSEAVGKGRTNAKTTSEMVKLVAHEDGIECRHPALRAAIVDAASSRGKLSAKMLGRWLSRNKDRISGGLRFAGQENRHTRAFEWWIEELANGRDDNATRR